MIIARLFDKINSNINNISNILHLSPDYVTLCERKRACKKGFWELQLHTLLQLYGYTKLILTTQHIYRPTI